MMRKDREHNVVKDEDCEDIYRRSILCVQKEERSTERMTMTAMMMTRVMVMTTRMMIEMMTVMITIIVASSALPMLLNKR